jgi:hypothetical protein
MRSPSIIALPAASSTKSLDSAEAEISSLEIL